MGCTGPKSIIEVREGMTFLDLTVRQISSKNSVYGSNIPLVLMNSFNTDTETRAVVRKYHDSDIRCFQQSRFPRISKDTLMPLPKSFDSPKSDWYPPGTILLSHVCLIWCRTWRFV